MGLADKEVMGPRDKVVRVLFRNVKKLGCHFEGSAMMVVSEVAVLELLVSKEALSGMDLAVDGTL